MLGKHIVHKYIHVLKFSYSEFQALTLKDQISWFAEVI